MKNLILKWFGLTPWAIGEAIRISVREEMAKQREENIDLITNRLNNSYDIDGMSSKLDDMHWSIDDIESRTDRWDNMSDKLEDMDMEAIVEEVRNQVDFDKVQELDDRLTELLAGYKLEVKLTQENY